MDRRSFGEVCRVRSVCWGTMMVEYLTPHTTRTLARAGYDWLWLDGEHGHHSYESMQAVIRTADDVGIIALVRVAQTDYSLIARALDMGADGVIVPRVETPEQVREIIDCAKYPPVGRRGFGIRPSVYGDWSISMRDRIEDQNNNRFLFIQLESRNAVNNIEDMLEEADGQLDGVFMGPADLLMDLGRPDEFDHPDLDRATRYVCEVCEQFGIASGSLAVNIEQARQWLECGCNLIPYGFDDAFLSESAAAARNTLRSLE